MAYVVTRLCVDCISTECVDVCPVDCFYKPLSSGGDLPNMLYISPNECIECAACEPACPWEAIFQEGNTPAAAADDIALNKRCDDERDQFETAAYDQKANPDPDQVSANKAKHGM